MGSDSSDFFKCKRCGNEFSTKYNVCGGCGEVAYELEQAWYSICPGEIKTELQDQKDPARLIKRIKEELFEQNRIRMILVATNKKLEDLVTVNSNGTGFINIQVNGASVRVSEGRYRVIVQEDVNSLMSELNNALLALEKFNSKFKKND